MQASRRLVLGALGALPFVSACGHSTAIKDTSRYLACARTPEGTFAAVILSDAGEMLSTIALPGRGHTAAVSPDKSHVIVFGRRPSEFMVAIDLETSKATAEIKSRTDRRFYGHGSFSADSKLLYASENAYEEASGVIGVYDPADGYKRIGEVPSGGIGPHQLILLRDGKTFAVANGGIETDPNFPRAKLNLATMISNLAYLDVATGKIVDCVEAPQDFHQLSLRHIAETADGAIWIGGQYEGPASDQAPLIAIHRRGQAALEFAGTQPDNAVLDNYIGSLVSSADHGEIALTSPRGGILQVWRAGDRKLLTQQSIADVCGISPAGSDFLASDGAGRLWRSSDLLSLEEGWSWDNHIVPL